MLGSGMNINWGGHTQGKGITMIYYIRLNRNYGKVNGVWCKSVICNVTKSVV